MTREEVLQALAPLLPHLHLLQAGDIPVRMELVIPQAPTSLGSFNVQLPGSEKATFRKRGREHVLHFNRMSEYDRVQERIVNRRPTFRLKSRVAGFGLLPEPPKAAPAPTPAPVAAVVAAAPVPVAPVGPVRYRDPLGLRPGRFSELRRLPERFVWEIYKKLPLASRLPRHAPKDDHIEAILLFEFPVMPAEEGGSEPAAVETLKTAAPLPTAEIAETAAAVQAIDAEPWTHERLSDLPWTELKAMATAQGVEGKSRTQLVDALLAKQLTPA